MGAMGYQPRARTPRGFGRRPEKVRPKTKAEKQRASGNYLLDEEHVPTRDEVVDRTVNNLHHLGTQRFAIAPFYEHFDRWLLSLRTVMSEFESSQVTSVDDQFARECSQALANIEQALSERRIKEMAREETLRKNSQSIQEEKRALTQIDREYLTKAKEITRQRQNTIRPVAGRLATLREELDRVIRMRAGFLRGISKKTKAQKTEETTHRLDTTKKELAKIEQSFVTEQERLKDEHRKRKQQILAEIARHQKEIESLEAEQQQMDDAADIRRSTCDALVNAVNALLQRTELSAKTTNSCS